MSIPKWFWVYIKNWACLKSLSMLKPNFEEADGLGIRVCIQNWACLKNLNVLKTNFESADGLGITWLKSTYISEYLVHERREYQRKLAQSQHFSTFGVKMQKTRIGFDVDSRPLASLASTKKHKKVSEHETRWLCPKRLQAHYWAHKNTGRSETFPIRISNY